MFLQVNATMQHWLQRFHSIYIKWFIYFVTNNQIISLFPASPMTASWPGLRRRGTSWRPWRCTSPCSPCSASTSWRCWRVRGQPTHKPQRNPRLATTTTPWWRWRAKWTNTRAALAGRNIQMHGEVLCHKLHIDSQNNIHLDHLSSRYLFSLLHCN